MHIVLYSPAWPPGSKANGIITYCYQLSEELKAQGHRVSIICGHQVADAENTYSIDNTVLSWKETLYAFYLKRYSLERRYQYIFKTKVLKILKAIEEKNSIDLFEMEESFGLNYYISEAINIPVVVRFHGPFFLTGGVGENEPPDSKSLRRLQAEKLAFQNIKYASSPSVNVLESTKKYTKCNWLIEEVVPNPIAIDVRDRTWSRAEASKHQILFVGRFDYLKGADVVLKAFDILVGQWPMAELVFVGPDKGLEYEGRQYTFNEFVESQLSEAARLRISNLGLLSFSRVMELRRQAAFTVMASRYENFPYAALESLAVGAPTVCPNVGGYVEIVEDKKSGRIFEAGNYESLAEEMAFMLKNPSEAAEYAASGRERAIEKYSSAKIAEQTLGLYRRVIAHFHGSAS